MLSSPYYVPVMVLRIRHTMVNEIYIIPISIQFTVLKELQATNNQKSYNTSEITWIGKIQEIVKALTCSDLKGRKCSH